MRNFPLHGFNKNFSWFRCSGKGKHLNLAQTHNSEANQLTTNALQDFQRLCPWFRSQAGLECSGMQTCPGGTSGRGIRQTRNRTAHASEPRQNTKDSPQFIEKLSITRIQRASPLVQIQRQREASEPCGKAESGSQPTHNKRIARFSTTVPVVQIPGRAGMPRNANVPWRCFRSRTAQSSEPEPNSDKPLQHIERLSVTRIQQAPPLVQIQRKREASEPCSKAEYGSQPTHNKYIAGLSKTAPEVQIPGRAGIPRNANVPWRCFWLG